MLTDTERYVEDFGREPEKPFKSRGKTLDEEFTKEKLKEHFDAIQARIKAEAQAQQAAQMAVAPADEEPEMIEEPDYEPDEQETEYINMREARRAARLRDNRAEKQFDYTKPASEAEHSETDEAGKQQEADEIRNGLEQILNRNKNIAELMRRENEEKSKNKQDEDEYHV